MKVIKGVSIVLAFVTSGCCIDDPLYLLGSHGTSGVEKITDDASLWTYESDYSFDHIQSFVLNDDLISVINYRDHTAVLCHNATTGERQWHQNGLGVYRAQSTEGCLLVNDKIILSDGEYTAAVSAKNGAILWRAETLEASSRISFSESKILKVKNTTGLIRVYSLDEETGYQEEVFHRTFKQNGNYEPDYFSPIIEKNSIGERICYLAGGDNIRRSAQVLALNIDQNKIEWEHRFEGEDYSVSNFVLSGDKLYTATRSTARCITKEGKILWQQEIFAFEGPNMVLENEYISLGNGQILDATNGSIDAQNEGTNAWATATNRYVSWCASEIVIYDKQTGEYSNYGYGFSPFGLVHPQKELYFASKGNVLFCLDLNKLIK